MWAQSSVLFRNQPGSNLVSLMDRYRGRKGRSNEKNMEESHLSKLGEEITVTIDDIPGAKLVKNTADRVSRPL